MGAAAQAMMCSRRKLLLTFAVRFRRLLAVAIAKITLPVGSSCDYYSLCGVHNALRDANTNAKFTRNLDEALRRWTSRERCATVPGRAGVSWPGL
jgi:hypothetical protein